MKGRLNRSALVAVAAALLGVALDGCGGSERPPRTTFAADASSAMKRLLQEPPPRPPRRLVMRVLLQGENAPADGRYANAMCEWVENATAAGWRAGGDKKKTAAERHHLLLVRDEKAERERADALFDCGYYPEAAYHYRNILAYHPAEGDPAREEVQRRLDACAPYLPERVFAARPDDDEEDGERRGLFMFMRVSHDYGVRINNEAIGAPDEVLPLYLQAARCEMENRIDAAIKRYERALTLVRKNSPAEADLHAKLAVLYNRRCDARAFDHYRAVLAGFQRLPLELWCCNRLVILSGQSESRLTPVIVENEEREPASVGRWAATVVTRGIRRLASAREQKPPPNVPFDKTYLHALERRREAFLDAFAATLPEPDAESLETMKALADRLILCGDFGAALRLLQAVASVRADDETAFKTLVCRIRIARKAPGRTPWFEAPRRPGEKESGWVEDFLATHPKTRFRREAEYLKARLLLAAGWNEAAEKILATLATRNDFEFAPDARLALQVLRRRLLKVNVPETLTSGPTLPVKITLRNVRKVTFKFFKVIGGVPVCTSAGGGKPPALDAQIRAFLDAPPAGRLRPAGEATAEFDLGGPGESETFDYDLPLPEKGVFVVEASDGEDLRGGRLSCRFAAVRSDAGVTVAVLPRTSVLTVYDGDGRPLSGVKIFAGDRFIGETDEDGFLFAGPLPAPRCDLCGGPCDYCSTCRKHWLKKTGGRFDGPPLELTCVGDGVLFKTQAAYKPPSAAPKAPGPLVYVYTDRPLYRAGDVVRFRGVLRLEKDRIGRRADSRFEPLVGERVRVEVKEAKTSAGRKRRKKLSDDGGGGKNKEEGASSTLYSREFVTGEFGTFFGEWRIPSQTARKKYVLVVTYGGASRSSPFEIRDFEKPDYEIRMVSEKGGFRVSAGYSWGESVPGAKVLSLVGDEQKELRPGKNGAVFVPVEDGQRVTVVLMKDGKELARKEKVFHAPKEIPPAEAKAGPEKRGGPEAAGPEAEARRPLQKPMKEARFAVAADKNVYRAGEKIKLTLVCRAYPRWRATVVVGDSSGYDCARVSASGATAVLELPACGAYDPGTNVWVHFTDRNGTGEHVEKLSLRMRTRLLDVKIKPEKPVCEPGEETTVTVTTLDSGGRPARAETSLAAVDEAIFTLAEDETPDIYDFFYKERKGACSFVDFRYRSLAGKEVLAESALDLSEWRYFNVTATAYELFLLPVPRGTSFDSLSGKNLDSTGYLDAYGIGGGRAGAYGARWGSGSLAREGGSCGTESAVVASGGWLRRHQSDDGRWDCDGFARNCRRDRCDGAGRAEYDVAVTSLSVLTFLGHGNTHRVGPFKKSVRKGLRWLLGRQAGDGSIGRNGGKFWFTNHALATFALCEAYAMTQDPWLRPACLRALEFLLRARNPNSGWGFEPNDGRPNSLATGWAVLALKAARSAGLDVPQSAFDGALRFFDSVTDLRGRTYFEKLGVADPDLIGDGRRFDALPEWTAAAALCSVFAGRSRRHPKVCRAMEIISRQPPEWDDAGRSVNALYWYWGTLAMFNHGGGRWKRWSAKMKKALIENQRRGGCADGSWDPVGRWGGIYGRVGATAMCALTMEIYYRYLRCGGPPESAGPEIRLFFPDTALWIPNLLTDESGAARVPFTLPDTITSLRLTARAVTKTTAVGEGVAWIELKKDFFVKLKSPKFFVRGDTSTIHADVYNYSGSAQKARLKLSGDGFDLVSAAAVETDAPGGGVPRRAYWTVRITSAREVAFTVAAEAGEFSDAVRVTVPVKVRGTEVVKGAEAPLRRGEAFTIRLPRDAAEGTASLEVVVRPKKSDIYYILDTLRYLVGYPYG